MIIDINANNPDDRKIKTVAKALKGGGLIIFPTDSVYAVGCDLYSKKGLEKLAKFKGIKLSQAKFSIFCQNISEVSEYILPISKSTFKILNQHLPGPFTFVLPANKKVSKLFGKARHEVGIRIPNHKILLDLLQELGNPIVTTSLIDETDEIQEYFTEPTEINQRYDEQVDLIVDGGLGRLYPSTVVLLTDEEPEVIRQGEEEFFY